MYMCLCITARTVQCWRQTLGKDGEEGFHWLEDALAPVESVTQHRQEIGEEIVLSCFPKSELEAIARSIAKEEAESP